MTAILVTHDQEEALSSTDYVAVIRDGTIAQFATPQELYDHPADAGLARFVGDANLLDGLAEDGLVHTPFGTLAVRDDLSAAPGKAVTVLIRPEQLDVRPGADGQGAHGKVISASFHGHDTLMSISPGSETVPSPVLARVHWNLLLLAGVGCHMFTGPRTGVRLAVRRSGPLTPASA